MIMDVKNLVTVNDDTLKRLMGEEKKEEKDGETKDTDNSV